jgi:predicted YcjX-like family ATPase
MADRSIQVVLNKQPGTEFVLSDEAKVLYATRMKEKTGKSVKIDHLTADKINRVCPTLVSVVRELGSSKASGATVRGRKKIKCWLTVATVRNTKFDIVASDGVEFCALVEHFDDDAVSVINMPQAQPAIAAAVPPPAGEAL